MQRTGDSGKTKVREGAFKGEEGEDTVGKVGESRGVTGQQSGSMKPGDAEARGAGGPYPSGNNPIFIIAKGTVHFHDA